MTRLRLIKTSFSAGELDPRLLGRIDLKAQEEGASRLRNVLVQATGGVSRRPGTAYVCDLQDARRLIGFDSPGGGEILALGPFSIRIVKDDAVIATLPAPWSAGQLEHLAWARLGDSLIVCHPEVEPQILRRRAPDDWALGPWKLDERDGPAAFKPSAEPFVRFAAAEVAMQPVRTDVSQPASAVIPAGATVELRASEHVFVPLHQGVRFRVRRRQVMVTNPNPIDHAKATALVLEDLPNGETTRDWDEAAFSAARGWPRALTFHQNRLVIGGARDLPERIWLSRTGRPFDFDVGSGLDDEAIAFRLAADRLHVISSVHSGRQLQVFTSAGEWVVKGFPLTPANVQVDQQTGIGSLTTRRLPPLGVDGATLFVGTTGRELREFLFADTEQAYQAADIALLARHLMLDPVDLTFDAGRRLLLIVRADGALAAVTLDRNSNVVAWSLLDTQGVALAALAFAGTLWLLVERAGVVRLERLDDTLHLDCALTGHSGTPRTTWFGFDHLDGQAVMVVADDAVVGPLGVTGGSFSLSTPANDVVVGLAFGHEIEALPIMAATGRGLTPDVPYRPIRITFRLLETRALHVDTGPGPRPLPLTESPDGYTGDIMTRATGWRRGIASPPWRIAQDLPRPCTVLSATTEIKVND
jgi:hypothetical protein